MPTALHECVCVLTPGSRNRGKHHFQTWGFQLNYFMFDSKNVDSEATWTWSILWHLFHRGGNGGRGSQGSQGFRASPHPAAIWGSPGPYGDPQLPAWSGSSSGDGSSACTPPHLGWGAESTAHNTMLHPQLFALIAGENELSNSSALLQHLLLQFRQNSKDRVDVFLTQFYLDPPEEPQPQWAHGIIVSTYISEELQKTIENIDVQGWDFCWSSQLVGWEFLQNSFWNAFLMISKRTSSICPELQFTFYSELHSITWGIKQHISREQSLGQHGKVSTSNHPSPEQVPPADPAPSTHTRPALPARPTETAMVEAVRHIPCNFLKNCPACLEFYH